MIRRGHSCSFRTNLVWFRTFRCPLFPKPVSWQGLFLPLLTANPAQFTWVSKLTSQLPSNFTCLFLWCVDDLFWNFKIWMLFKTNLAPLCCSHLRIPNSSSSISFWRRAGRTWLSLWFEENSTPPNFKRWCDFLRPAHSFLSFQFSQWGQSLVEVAFEKLCFYNVKIYSFSI